MALGEPKDWAKLRQQRLAQMYPELSVASAKELLDVDAYRMQRGQPPSQFTQQMLNLALFAREKGK